MIHKSLQQAVSKWLLGVLGPLLIFNVKTFGWAGRGL